jgi:hypothetical protein
VGHAPGSLLHFDQSVTVAGLDRSEHLLTTASLSFFFAGQRSFAGLDRFAVLRSTRAM